MLLHNYVGKNLRGAYRYPFSAKLLQGYAIRESAILQVAFDDGRLATGDIVPPMNIRLPEKHLQVAGLVL